MRRWDDFELGLDMQPAFDHLERICAAILVDAAQPEPEDGDDADPKPRVIRPTGRAHRARQPYTITPAARQTNWFAKSLEFDNHDFQDFYRLVKSFSDQ